MCNHLLCSLFNGIRIDAKGVHLLMSAVVAGVTVGGKAFGKSIAMSNSTSIVHTAAKIIYAVKSVPKLLKKLFIRR